jgi:hypothetical protein
MAMMTIQTQVDTVILSVEACRLYGEPTRICNCRSQSRTGGRAAGSNSQAPRALPRHSPAKLRAALTKARIISLHSLRNVQRARCTIRGARP